MSDLLTNYSEIESLNSEDCAVRTITDYTDLNQYPEIEGYLYQEFDKKFSQQTYENMMQGIISLSTEHWKGTKLDYALKAFFKYINANLIVELDEMSNFFDPYFLKQFDIAKIESVSGDLELQTLYKKYYERFFELFYSNVNYLQDYLNIFEKNSDILNVDKKDLLIYHGEQIYEFRGTQKGFRYIKNIFNPLFTTNKYTGEKIRFPIEISVQEYGEFDLPADFPEDKKMYVYNLGLSNLSNANIKLALIDVIKNLVHPAGYNANISDYITFAIPLKINTVCYSQNLKTAEHSYYQARNSYQYTAGTRASVVSPSPIAEYDIDFELVNEYQVEDGAVNFVLNFSA